MTPKQQKIVKIASALAVLASLVFPGVAALAEDRHPLMERKQEMEVKKQEFKQQMEQKKLE